MLGGHRNEYNNEVTGFGEGSWPWGHMQPEVKPSETVAAKRSIPYDPSFSSERVVKSCM